MKTYQSVLDGVIVTTLVLAVVFAVGVACYCLVREVQMYYRRRR